MDTGRHPHAVDLHRRHLIKGAAGVAAAALVPTSFAEAAPTAAGYLWLQAELAQTSSAPGFTRVYLPKLVESRYIEFVTKSAIFGSANPSVNQIIDVYVPESSDLYFSENPPPFANLTANASAFRAIPPPSTPQRISGLVLSDGSPATVLHSGSNGFVSGVSGREKDGSAYSIALAVRAAQFPGRSANADVTWVVCGATILSGSNLVSGASGPVASGAGSPLLFNFGFSPEAGLAFLALSYQDVTTSVVVDLSTAVAAGYSYLRRVANYYGQPFSQQTLNNPAPTSVVAMPLLASPVWESLPRVSALAPALTQIVRPAPAGSPLISLGSLDPGTTELKAQYVARCASATAGALPALASALCDASRPGLSELARWLGWATVLEQSSLATAFGAAFDNAQALRKSNGPSAPFKKLPIMKDGDADELADKILDWVDDQKS